MQEFQVRDYGPDDVAFLFSSWLKSYRKGSDATARVQSSIYFTFQHALIQRLLLRGASVKVACLPDSPDTILGYVVTEQAPGVSIVHYAYTKEAFRRRGIMTQLLLASGLDQERLVFTHYTSTGGVLARKRQGISHNPYLAQSAV